MTKKVPNEAKMVGLKIFQRFLSKIFRLTGGRQKFGHYMLITIEYFGFIEVLSIVLKKKNIHLLDILLNFQGLLKLVFVPNDSF